MDIVIAPPSVSPVKATRDFVVQYSVPVHGGAYSSTYVDWPVDPRLVPVSLQWAADGGTSILQMRYDLGSKPSTYSATAMEDAQVPPAGSRVDLILRVPESAESEDQIYFRGVVAQDNRMIQGDPEGQAVSLVAYGPELMIGAKKIRGQWHLPQVGYLATDAARSDLFQTDLPCVFNPGGLPNGLMLLPQIGSTGTGINAANYAFTSPAAGATAWTAYTALQALVEWVDNYDFISLETNWLAIADLTEDLTLNHVDVTGMGLMDAFSAILSPFGLGFFVYPYPDDDGRFVFEVYHTKKASRNLRPYMAPDGSHVTTAAGQGKVSRLHIVRDNHNVANRVTVMGKPQETVAQFVLRTWGDEDIDNENRTLWPAWLQTGDFAISTYIESGKDDLRMETMDATLKEKLFAYADPQEADDLQGHSTRMIGPGIPWRSFGVNEDGALYHYNSSGPESTNLAAMLGQSQCARVPRPVGPMVRDATGQESPAEAWLIWESGSDQASVRLNIAVWPDRAGFTVLNPIFVQGDNNRIPWKPFAALAEQEPENTTLDALKDLTWLGILNAIITRDNGEYRIVFTGTIEGDYSASGGAETQAAWSTWAFRSERIVKSNHRSISLYDEQSFSRSTLVDQSPDANLRAAEVQSAMDDQVGHGSVILRDATLLYPPGTGLPGTYGRQIDIDFNGGSRRYAPVVRAVNVNFGDAHTTELVLDSPLVQVTAP